MIDIKNRKVLMPIVVEVEAKKPKIDRVIDIFFDITKSASHQYSLNLQNPFSHTKALVVLIGNDKLLKFRSTLLIADKDNCVKIEFSFTSLLNFR